MKMLDKMIQLDQTVTTHELKLLAIVYNIITYVDGVKTRSCIIEVTDDISNISIIIL